MLPRKIRRKKKIRLQKQRALKLSPLKKKYPQSPQRKARKRKLPKFSLTLSRTKKMLPLLLLK